MPNQPPNLYVSGAEWNKHNVLALLPLIRCEAGCAKCCEACHPIAVQENEIERIGHRVGVPPHYLKGTWKKIEERLWTLPQPCPFLKDDRCEIYAERPVVCKYYPLQRVTRNDGLELVGVTIGLCEAGRPIIDKLQGLQVAA